VGREIIAVSKKICTDKFFVRKKRWQEKSVANENFRQEHI
jgi:hypothetical protein